MDKKLGFTLSEVLITLGIIGVVAAITIPMLMSHYNKYITETRLKAVYSTILQGIKMAQYNETALLDSAGDDGDVNGFSYRRSEEVFEAMFLPVFSGCTLYPKNSRRFYFYSADGTTSFGSNYFYTIYVGLNNGTVLGFSRGGNYDGFVFDVILNPQKKKLLAGKDYFTFLFRNDGLDNYAYRQLFNHKYDNPSGREKVLEYCKANNRYPADFSSPSSFCAHAIVQNGFKIPANYPIKF